VAPVATRATAPRRPRPHDAWALGATALLLLFVAVPLGALVQGSLQVDGEWSLGNYRALAEETPGGALAAPVSEALVASLRIAVDATWMALGLGLVLALLVTRRS